MLRINMGGTFSNLQVVNSPGRAVAIGGSSLTVSNVHVNNGACAFTQCPLERAFIIFVRFCSAAGSASNSKSSGKPAGANTDGFDVSANNVIIKNSQVENQGI